MERSNSLLDLPLLEVRPEAGDKVAVTFSCKLPGAGLIDGTRDFLPCDDDGRRSVMVRIGEVGRLARTRCALVSWVKLRSTRSASSPKPKKEKKY